MKRIEEKILARQRLSADDGLTLLESQDLFTLGNLADFVCAAQNARRVFYIINRHIAYTNICRNGCLFCHFRQEERSPRAFTLTVEDITEQAAQASDQGATEIHIVGGVNPNLSLDYCIEMIRSLRGRCPGITIKAFTATEILDLSGKSGLSAEAVLQRLMEAGLDALPGGGAEILDEEYFRRYCPAKPIPKAWLEVHRTAHRMGLPTNATMLFGYQETHRQRIEHMIQLRNLQEESLQQNRACFQCFVPLPYVSSYPAPPPNGMDILKTIAVSRLVLDNIRHIKAFWPMMGVPLAQIALCFGADDLDGTVGRYRIVDPVSQNGESFLTESQILSIIRAAGFIPQKRNGAYPPPSP